MPPSSQHPLGSMAGAQQDVLDATINQTVFALAFVLGGVVVLGACAYMCFFAVGRWRRRAVCSGGDLYVEQEGLEGMDVPRRLILPRKVEADAKAPRRLILSPLYTVGTDIGKDAFEDDAEEDLGSWPAS